MKRVRSKDQPAPEDDRKAELKGAELEEDIFKLMEDVEKGFREQEPRSDDLMDYWDMYNCKLSGDQYYDGNSEIFVPIVKDAIDARKTRFTNQIFPVSGRNIEVSSSNDDIPHAETALIESHIRHARLRTTVVPSLLINGDVEGQYTVFVSWREKERNILRRVKKPVQVNGAPVGAPDVDDIQEDTIIESGPHVEVIADPDILVLPATADTLDDALEQGGSVTLLRRWTKKKLLKMADDGEIDADGAKEAIANLLGKEKVTQQTDKAKEQVDAAGIRGDGRGKFVQVYETWTYLKVNGERTLVRIFFGGDKNILSCRRNPLWCDRLPILSVPVNKIQGSFKGRSRVADVYELQLQANDACNQAMDSAAYALLPIVMTDPEKNPRVGSMVLSLAAVWETDPKSTTFAQFPPLWKDGLEIVMSCRQQIMTTLSVNPSQITQAAGSKTKKMNQAEVANEQQIDLLTTADAVGVIEEGILTPLVSLILELDHQYRTKPMLVQQYGGMGRLANMQMIEPIQMDNAYQFRWFGVEQARSAQQIQQQIAALNVARGIPPEMYPGYKLDMGPAMNQMMENVFGPRLAGQVFKDQREQLPVDPGEENAILLGGYPLPVHMDDDDRQHIQIHMQAAPMDQQHKTVRAHIMSHLKSLSQKMGKAQGGKGGPGMPGGAGPGSPGTPRAGAQPGAPRGIQGPPGMIHADRMRDPRMAPRG